MSLSRAELDHKLAEIEKTVPTLMQDRNAFPRLFEDQVEILLGQLAPSDQDYALARLEAIVERSGYNR